MFDIIRGWFGIVKDFFQMVAQTSVGRLVNEIQDMAIEVVYNIEQENGDLSGTEKFRIAYDTLVDRYPWIMERAINLAIEMAVAVIKDKVREANK